MRTCQACGKENPSERDFCDCGEYLRWEPTGFIQAITPEVAQAAADAAPPAIADSPQPATSPPPPSPAPPDAARRPAQPPPVAPAPPPPAPGPAGTLAHGAAAAPPAPPQPEQEAPKSASISLRLPDDSAAKDEPLALGVDAGGRERVLALIRNQSGIVDNYELSVRGMPDSWWTVYPDMVYLVPFGAGGTYEQEVEVHLHPPRAAEAEARLWELEIVALSKAYGGEAATAPFVLGIQPFEELGTKVEPERASGRRKARYEVRVENKANAPTNVAFDGADPDGDCAFTFAPAQVEVAPGETRQTTMTVRPPKQMWIGRPHERRLEVRTMTGEAAAAIAEPVEDAGLDEAGGGAKGLLGRAEKGVPGVRGPKISKPRFGKPNLSVGPGGVRLRQPQVRGPQVRGPQLKQMNLRLDQLKMPSRGQGAPVAAGPLLPTQAVFRQKSWLPWWVALVIPLLLLLLLLLYLFLPKNAEVPSVVGKPSAFAAEELITKAKLRLSPQVKEKVDAKAKPGTVLDQTPAPGETAEEGGEVSIVVAVGTGKVTVPDLTGKSPSDAEKALRDETLSLGQSTPQPVNPKSEIKSQIPAAKEIVKEGTPVDIFTVVPGAKGGAGGVGAQGEGEGEGEGQGEGQGEGEGEGEKIKVPEIAGAAQDAYAKKVGDLGLIPKVVKQYDESERDTVFRVAPEPGEEIEAGKVVTLFVSLGFPKLAFDNDRDVFLATGSKGETLEEIAKGTQTERDPAWSFDGSRIAFTSAGQVFVKNLTDPDATARALTKEGERYRDLAWAPTVEVDVLALVADQGGSTLADAKTALCFGTIDGGRMTPRCKDTSANVLGRKVNWSPNGKSLLAFGAKPDGTEIGMIRYRSKRAYSADPDDWESDGFVTDVSKPGEGVLDAVVSPDGKQLAAVVLDGNGTTDLVLTKAGDFPLFEGEALGVRACKVIWRPDGQEFVVVRNDQCLGTDTGELIRLPVANPKKQRSLRLRADNATFQPLAAE